MPQQLFGQRLYRSGINVPRLSINCFLRRGELKPLNQLISSSEVH